MTYVPIVPTIPSSESTDNDHRDLITALKLLSGEGCVRDASQAQVLLVGLTESHHDDVAEDAIALMQTGLKQGWFENTMPTYYTLRNIAERSVATFEKGGNAQQQRLLVTLLAGIIALGIGMMFYFRTSGGLPSEFPSILVIGLIVAVFAVFLKFKKS